MPALRVWLRAGRDERTGSDDTVTIARSMVSPATAHKVKALVDGVQALADEMTARWGVGRLRLLVDDDLRSRFDSQLRKFNTAVWEGTCADVEIEAARMANAWRTLDKAAVEAGAKPLEPNVWEVALPDGRVAAIVPTVAEEHAVTAEGRYVVVLSLAEVANLIHGFPELIRMKKEIPGARVTDVRPLSPPPIDWSMGDEVTI